MPTTAVIAACECARCRDRQTYMAKILVSAEHKVDAPADVVYRYVADMREHHPHFLPPAFSGGVGAGTITRFKMTAGGRTREYRMKVAEPEPGRILTESDTDSSAVTTFTISPQGGASIVQISTTWDGAGGIGGLFGRCSRRGCCAPSMRTNLSDSMRTRANIAQT